MALELGVVETTGSDHAVRLSTILTATGPTALHLKLLTIDDPAVIPSEVATVHLSASSPSTTPGFFLTPNAPVLDVVADPSELWVSVHGENEFVQILAG